MSLTVRQKKHLRGLAHRLKTLARVGNAGLSPTFLAELDRTLGDHELVKVKISADDRDTREALLTRLLEASRAELVFRVGHTALLYRKSPDAPRIVLP